MKTELEQIEKMSPLKLFKPKAIGILLKAIETEVQAFVPDVETPDGRKQITSLAYKVARSKTAIDNLGKDFVAVKKAEVSVIDEVRRTARDFLDNLKATVRQPLTEWEEAEQKRIDRINTAIDVIRIHGDPKSPVTGEFLSAKILLVNQAILKDMKITKKYGEWQDEAINAKNASLVNLAEAIPAQEVREQEAENARLYAEEQAENQRIEEEQRIARGAVEAADLESTKALEQIQETAAQEKADQELRDTNTRHKGAVNKAAAEALATVAKLPYPTAQQIIKIIVKGQIPNVTIKY